MAWCLVTAQGQLYLLPVYNTYDSVVINYVVWVPDARPDYLYDAFLIFLCPVVLTVGVVYEFDIHSFILFNCDLIC
jgi:hypothetical protein